MDSNRWNAFEKENPIEGISSAYLTYIRLAEPKFNQFFDKATQDLNICHRNPEQEKIIKELSTPEEFFKWMRKEITGESQNQLRERLLENENLVEEMIKKRICTSMVDLFVENSVNFFIRCETNHADWILENYDKIKNPYAQCMLCLVLGFRGDLTCEEFLLEQISYFRKNYPEERFDQGPLIAVYLVNHQEKKLSLL